jgi:ubiquinone/menaquinone biosynthesis C-methylase UbiE
MADPTASPDTADAAAFQISAEAAEVYDATFVPIFSGWTRHLVERLAPRSGDAVLDVACGTGAVARLAADRVGPTGRVVGVDRNPAMLAVARRVRPDLEWQEADAAELPFADGELPVVACQLALMFLPDPVAALAEMARVAGPGGTVAGQVPGRLAESPGFAAFVEAVRAELGAGPAAQLGGYFADTGVEQLAGRFAAAGIEVVEAEVWSAPTVYPSLEAFAAVEVRATPLGDDLDDDDLARLVEVIRAPMAPYATPAGEVAVRYEAFLVRGRPA